MKILQRLLCSVQQIKNCPKQQEYMVISKKEGAKKQTLTVRPTCTWINLVVQKL